MDLADWAGLAATTFVAALLQAVSGFGFAVLATPLYLLFIEPATAVQLVIIIAAILSLVVLPGLHRAIAPGLLLRLTIGALAGLPLGLAAFRRADPALVRLTVGLMILSFAALLALSRLRPPSGRPALLRLRPATDLVAGAVSGVATAMVGMAGPPLLIYLLLAGALPRTVRATLLSFFALTYSTTLAGHAVGIGIPTQTWIAAAIMTPFAIVGGLAGRPIGDRLGTEAFAVLAIALLGASGLYALVAAARAAGGG